MKNRFSSFFYVMRNTAEIYRYDTKLVVKVTESYLIIGVALSLSWDGIVRVNIRNGQVVVEYCRDEISARVALEKRSIFSWIERSSLGSLYDVIRRKLWDRDYKRFMQKVLSGNADSQFLLGRKYYTGGYLHGQFIEKNPNKGQRLISLAASSYHEDSVAYLRGELTENDIYLKKFRKRVNGYLESISRPMEKKEDLRLPPELETIRNILDECIRPFLKIVPIKNKRMEYWQSKFLHFPYLPKGMNYPKDKNGKNLVFIAQINFEEVPAIPELPEQGILQFYLSDDFGEKEDCYTVFFPEVKYNKDYLITDFSFIGEHTDIYIPVEASAELYFEKRYQLYVPTLDEKDIDKFYRSYLKKKFVDQENVILDLIQDYIQGVDIAEYTGCQFGGNTTLYQYHPELMEDNAFERDLLLQIGFDHSCRVSEEFNVIGEGAFFINFLIERGKILKKDFSQVTCEVFGEG